MVKDSEGTGERCDWAARLARTLSKGYDVRMLRAALQGPLSNPIASLRRPGSSLPRRVRRMHICAYTLPQRSSSHTTGRYHLHVCAACREFPPVLAPETRPTRACTQAQGFGRRTRRCVCPCPSSAPQDAANTEGSQGATVVSLRTSKGGGPFSTSDPFPDLLYGT